MVIIIPDSKCFYTNLELIAQHMINIETNKHIYKINNTYSECKKCLNMYETNSIMLCQQSNTELNNNKYDLNKDNFDKFNIYQLNNNEIEIETNLNFGRIILYTLNDINIDIKRYLEIICNRYTKNIIGNIFTNIDINDRIKTTNNCIISNTCDLNKEYLTRKIFDNEELEPYSNSRFKWSIYIIKPSLNNVIPNNIYLLSKKSSYMLKWFNNNLSDVQSYLNNPFNIPIRYLLYSPSTIILDCANFLKPNIYKLLNYPSINELSINNFIKNIILINDTFGILFYIYQHLANNLTYNRFKNHTFNDISNMYKIFKSINFINLIENIDYVFQYQNNMTYEKNLEWDIDQILQKYKLLKKYQNTNKRNKCDNNNNNNSDKCYITGLPLFDIYFEIYFNILIKNKKVLSKMYVSLYGFNLLCSKNNILENNLSNLFSKGKFNTINNFYIYKNYHKNTIYDGINMMNILDKEKKLLETFEKYGICKNTQSRSELEKLLTYNPENNQIYIGLDIKDITDSFLLYMQNKSDSILFAYKFI